MTALNTAAAKRWPLAAAYALVLVALAELLLLAATLATGAARPGGDEGWQAHLFQLGAVVSSLTVAALLVGGGARGPALRLLFVAAALWMAAIAGVSAAGL